MTRPAVPCPGNGCPKQIPDTAPACDEHARLISKATMNAIRKAARENDWYIHQQWIEQARHECRWATGPPPDLDVDLPW